jgi:hypothetical protein
MGDETMRYDLLAQEAMRGVVRLALERAASPTGLPGEHHFYITFVTHHPGVSLPPHLLEEYPEEMTIVLKRHYWDLEVSRDDFSVGLSFHGKHESIRVPYEAVVRFLDPEAQFVLQFPRPEVEAPPPRSAASPEPEGQKPEGEAEVVSLDAFRKR